MEIERTMSELKRLENNSARNGCGIDAVKYAFQRLGLGLLAKISKTKIEEDTYTSQESGKQRFRCKTCETEGYIEEWDEQAEPVKKIIKDCPDCKGEGFIEILVVDKRKKAKKKDLYYDDEY